MAVDKGPQLRIFVIIMIILAIVTIILRFWSRAVSKEKHGQRSRFWWDDWTALMSLPVTIITLSLTLAAIHFGLGRHVDTISPQNTTKILKIILANELVFNLGITLPKISALLFYIRIFGSSRSSGCFRYSLWIIRFCILGWFIALALYCVFVCNPIRKQWLPNTPGHCHSTGSVWLGSAIPSVVIDLLILLVPLPMIWPLRMDSSRKALIIGVFICGYCVVVISLGRLITEITSETQLDNDVTFAGVQPLYWLMAEPPLSLLSISLPSIFFLIRRLFREGFISLFTSRNAGTRDRMMGKGDPRPSANHISRVKNRSQNAVGKAGNELDRLSFDSWRNILPLVPGGQEYQVYVGKTSSIGSSKRFSVDQIRVRSEVRVNSENIV